MEPASGPKKNLVRTALAQILQSPPFRTSRQCQDLLSYVVEHSLSGEEELLRERIIGIEVFARQPNYDTADDPVVRIRAAEIRKRLAQYYQIAREEQKTVRIEMPSGSYKAIFEWRHDETGNLSTEPAAEVIAPPIAALSPPSAVTNEESAIQPRSRAWGWPILISGLLAALLGWAGLSFFASADQRAFNKFWSPVLDSSNTVLIYLGSNAVYELSPAYSEAYHQQHPLSKAEQMGLQFYVPLSPGTKLNAEDLVASKDTFVTIGDVAATTKIVTLLVQRKSRFDIRYGSDVAYGDLRQSPTVLIGAYNNFWTIAMTDNLRFVFDLHQSIQDRSDPKRRWSTNHDSTEDYAIVSRILNSKTGGTIVTAAGISHTGTRAAAEFLTNPMAIAALAKSLPKGWENKNVQIVLHTNVINQIPNTPDVIATYCW
jgi:hypothetical protein